MKTFKKIILASIILLLTASCKKDDLPKATQEGKNIMAAKVNGKTWIQTACWSCINGGSGLRANYSNNILNIVGQGSSNSTIELLLFVDRPSQYQSNSGFNSFEFRDYNTDEYYKTTPKTNGIVNITKIDRSKKIISGTFSFKAENEDDPNDIITVADGRFDVIYN
ncbi:DUF6252 family protein [Pedobacter arcticus]|uniref:DUF6252 family protein n=1 Tax=Pedobacter arcticus TaxID=752140 RepID=UPI0002F08F63|nr:DUF6252 family protein [Pedobacter arcticus]